MGIYSDVIRKRDENNRLLEHSADRSLLEDMNIYRLEDAVEDAQTAALYILEKLGLSVDRQYGCKDIDTMIEALLDPLGVMYDFVDTVTDYSGKKTDYVLAFREDGKAVALMPSLLGYRYFCPSDSSSGFATKKYCRSLKKGCYVFHRPLPEGPGTLAVFGMYVLRSLSLRDVLLLIAATGLSTLLGFVIPIISRWVYKTYIPNPSSAGARFGMALGIYVTVVVARMALGALKSISLNSAKVRVSGSVQSAVMAKLLNRPLSFFRDTTSGKLSTRISNCTRLSEMILDIVMDVLLNFSFSLAYLHQLRRMEPSLFMPAIIFLGMRILVSIIGGICNMFNQSRQMQVDIDGNGFLNSAIRGIQKIKATGSEQIIYAKWSEYYRRQLALTYKKPFFLKYSTDIMAALTTLATVVLLWQAMGSGLSSGDYLTFTTSYALIVTAVRNLTDIMQNMFLVRALCRNISPLLAGGNQASQFTEYVHRLRGGIRAENIHFAYPGDPRGCLDGVTVSVQPGEKVAIVGESGCGKSTLLKILMGMEKPDEGNVFYDGESINGLNLKSLRRCIGSVFQFSRLFPGTIYDNVCLGNGSGQDDANVWAALDFVGYGDSVRKLPLQLQTEISETNSSGFSGGQRQMILLARAVLDRPSVLILDEATSALDNISQEYVLSNIKSLRATVIMVAHRLSTVAGFDRIIVLKNGKIAEEGSYAELMRRGGVFTTLVRKQLVKDPSGDAS